MTADISRAKHDKVNDCDIIINTEIEKSWTIDRDKMIEVPYYQSVERKTNYRSIDCCKMIYDISYNGTHMGK